jgi:hypothetical protein
MNKVYFSTKAIIAFIYSVDSALVKFPSAYIPVMDLGNVTEEVLSQSNFALKPATNLLSIINILSLVVIFFFYLKHYYL